MTTGVTRTDHAAGPGEHHHDHHGYHHGDLAAACVDAGIRLVEEGGPDAVTIRGVARLAGVSHTAPLHHFPDRAALLAAVAERGFDLLLERLESGPGADAGPRDRLRAYGIAYVLHATDHPGLFSLMFGADRHPAGQGAYDLLMGLCTAAQATGELPGSDPYRLALLLWSTVHGLASLIVSGRVAGDDLRGRPGNVRVVTARTIDDIFLALMTSEGALE
jgi:AcrR family transcriptional regulator